MSNLLLNVMEAFAQFERKLIRERQRRGLRSQGGKGSTPAGNRLLRPHAAAELRRRVALGDSKAGLAREFGIGRDTLYRHVPVKERRAGKRAK